MIAHIPLDHAYRPLLALLGGTDRSFNSARVDQLLLLGIVIPPLIGNLCIGYIDPTGLGI